MSTRGTTRLFAEIHVEVFVNLQATVLRVTVNLQGQLIGIPTLGAVNTETNTTANGVSFAIPSNLVKTVVQQILQQ